MKIFDVQDFFFDIYQALEWEKKFELYSNEVGGFKCYLRAFEVEKYKKLTYGLKK